MEGQKLKIPEGPSHNLPGRSPMSPILSICYVKLSTIPEKRLLAAILASTCSRSSQADLGLDTTIISCFPHTLFDEINDSVVNFERGELVRGSDPPLV